MHGFGCDSRFWEPQVAALRGAGWDVAAPDLPYHGGPTQGVEPSLRGLAAWVVGRLGATPAVLIGHSMGGMMALQIAHDRPDVTRAVVLVDAFPSLEMVAAHLPTMFVPGRHRAVRRWIEDTREEILRGMGPDVFDSLWPTVADFDARAWLPEITCRTLAVIGGRRLYGAEDADRLKAAAQLGRLGRTCSVVVVPMTGHFLNLEKPEAVNDAILAWLATL